ncbi:MAG: hypothetical protein PHY47_20075 [Lachnospiraceae bacterium]|nr:hypothetical protein [Lachnospiraceae bacterium]
MQFKNTADSSGVFFDALPNHKWWIICSAIGVIIAGIFIIRYLLNSRVKEEVEEITVKI